MTKQIPRDENVIHFKDYLRFEKIKLPRSFSKSRIKLETAIEKRRSRWQFSRQQISINELSKLLNYTCGITHRNKNLNLTRRAYPSAGARYPLEVYILFIGEGAIKPGLYHYNVKRHLLERLLEGNFQDGIINSLAIANRDLAETAFLFFLITAIPSRTFIKYKEPTEKFILLETGHLVQNTYLIAEAMGIGCCAVGSFDENTMNKLLDIDGIYERIVYLVAIGKTQK